MLYLQYKEITLISSNKAVGTDGALELIEEEGLHPADIFDLLALNRTYPASPGIKKFYSLSGMAIISLGSLLPCKNKKMLKLTPALMCRENTKNTSYTRRMIYFNQTAFYDEFEKKIKRTDNWWPKGTWFAATL